MIDRYNRPGYSDDFTRAREAEQRQAAAEEQARQRVNERLRDERRARQQAERDAEREKKNAATRVALQPAMDTAEREWRIAQPGEDFKRVEKLVWEGVVAKHEEDLRAAEQARLRASGRYSF